VDHFCGSVEPICEGLWSTTREDVGGSGANFAGMS